jgi:hypothetical protein
MIAANDLSSPMNIAGRPFSIRERSGGLLNLRVALLGSSASQFARDLAALGGVRVVRGPESIGRGTCFLVHCPGFKVVLSPCEAEAAISALVSRVPIEVGSEMTSELTATLTILMREQSPRPSDTSTWRKGFTFGRQQTSSRIAGAPQTQHQSFSAASFVGKRKPFQSGDAPLLRQTALRPGKPLARKTPLTRRTPLARGKSSRS